MGIAPGGTWPGGKGGGGGVAIVAGRELEEEGSGWFARFGSRVREGVETWG